MIDYYEIVTLMLDGCWAKGVDPARYGYRAAGTKSAATPARDAKAYPMDPEIERLAKFSVETDIKSGRPAESCRYRFKALPDRAPDGGRVSFAIQVLALAAVELDTSKVTPLRWFAPAGPGEKVDYGSDDWNGCGFMEPETGEIWIRDDTPIHLLAETIAHEACHALKHRGRANSIEAEAEAIAFGRRIGELLDLPDDPRADLFVVGSRADLPCRAEPGSRAWCKGELALYHASHKGTPRAPRWHCYLRLEDWWKGVQTDAASVNVYFEGSHLIGLP